MNKSLIQFRNRIKRAKLRYINDKYNSLNQKVVYSGDKDVNRPIKIKNKYVLRNINNPLEKNENTDQSVLIDDIKELSDKNFPAIFSYFHRPQKIFV